MEIKDFGFEIKEVTQAGTVEGYAAVFGNVDHGGDKILPGAFVESLRRSKQQGRSIKMLFNHDANSPIGVWDDLAEDAKGLWVKGQMVMEVPKAVEVHALMRAKAIGGLSIGYVTDKSDMDNGVRLLQQVDLYEVSAVTFPMNDRARITDVKGDGIEALIDKLKAGDRLSVREFELLAKGLGLSNSQAERAARVNLKGQGDPAEAANDGADFLAALLSNL